ncbi:hypothetical protein [Massilia phosphatilytica]
MQQRRQARHAIVDDTAIDGDRIGLRVVRVELEIGLDQFPRHLAVRLREPRTMLRQHGIGGGTVEFGDLDLDLRQIEPVLAGRTALPSRCWIIQLTPPF